MVTESSLNVFGTSSETTSSVTAKANTASLSPSMRAISPPRQRNPVASWPWNSFSRSIYGILTHCIPV
jgi:hypothetical protein